MQMEKQGVHSYALWIAVLVLSLCFIAVAFLLRDQLSHFRTLGLLGIFLANFLASAIPFVPIPGIATVVAGGMLYTPFLVALMATGGAVLGDSFSYVIGLSGEKVFLHQKYGYYEQLVLHLKKYGALVIFLFAFIPNPLFDVVGVVAGLLNYPAKKFIVWLCIGRLLRNVLLAFFGARIL